MPSLLPKKRIQPESAPLCVDLARVFDSKETKATRTRVIKYLDNIYKNYSNKSREETERPYFVTEEFFIAMPTVAAFETEINLCESIIKHSENLITDEDIKIVLNKFIETHTFVYQNNERGVKAGDLLDWAETDLVYLTGKTDKNLAFTCNHIQAWLIKLMHEDIKFKAIKL